MKTILTLLLLINFYPVNAGDPEKLRTITKEGNKVYVTSDDQKLENYAKEMLKKGCWKLEENPDSCNFVLKLSGKSVLDYFAYAEIIDPKTHESLYRTPSANTVMSVTLSTKKKAVKKLINKHVKPMCDPYFFDSDSVRKRF